MSKTARCLFEVTNVTPDANNGAMQHVTLQARYENGTPDERSFSQFTPSGQLTAAICNPSLDGFFAPGRKFYVDLTPVDQS